MNALLAVFTCRVGSDALLRHWPYFLRQKATNNVIITTLDTDCKTPEGVERIPISGDSYINGDHLPRRMLDTMEELTNRFDFSVLMLAEYDTVIFHQIELQKMKSNVAGHLAGFETWGSKAKRFYHNPHVFWRGIIPMFIETGRKAIEEGVCGRKTNDAYGLPESSPDVFFGYICERIGLEVQTDLWTEFSRNSFDHREHLEEAKKAFFDGFNVIHGIKTKEELEYISGQSV